MVAFGEEGENLTFWALRRVDATLKVGVGDLNNQEKLLGCHVSLWTSDSSVACKIFPKWQSVATLNEIVSAAPGSLVCETCVSPLVTVGCSTTSTGYCDSCKPCDVGMYRFGCVPGGNTAGVCRPCKTLPETPNGERTFKSIAGTPFTQCRDCKVCGGKDQDGYQYHSRACTDRNDTVCRDCPSCAPGLVRVGCAEDYQGICIASVRAIKATANVNLLNISVQRKDLSLKVLQDHTLRLMGSRKQTKLKIKYDSEVEADPAPQQWYLMLSSVDLLGVQEADLDGAQILSDPVLLSPSDLTISPAMIFSTQIIAFDNATFEPALLKWDGKRWQRQEALVFDAERSEIQGSIRETGAYVVASMQKRLELVSPYKVVLVLGLAIPIEDVTESVKVGLIGSVASAAQISTELVRISFIEATLRRAPGVQVGMEVAAADLDSAAAVAGKLTIDTINFHLAATGGLPTATMLEAASVQESKSATLWNTQDSQLQWSGAMETPTAQRWLFAVGLPLAVLGGLVLSVTVGAVALFKRRSRRNARNRTMETADAGIELGQLDLSSWNEHERPSLVTIHEHECSQRPQESGTLRPSNLSPVTTTHSPRVYVELQTNHDSQIGAPPLAGGSHPSSFQAGMELIRGRGDALYPQRARPTEAGSTLVPTSLFKKAKSSRGERAE